MTAPTAETPSTGSLQPVDGRWPAWAVDTAIAAGVSAALLAALTAAVGSTATLVALLTGWARERRQNGVMVDAKNVRAWLVQQTRASSRIRTAVDRVLKRQAYPQGWLAGERSARTLLHPRAMSLRPSGGITLSVDWGGWQPGDAAAARKLVDGPAFRRLLDDNDTTIAGITDTMLDEVARCLSDGLERGATPQRLAEDLRATVEDKDKALTIAWTETTRAISAAAQDTYREAGIASKGWMNAADQRVCKRCAANELQGFIPLNARFASGDLYPPGHPRCRCAPIPGPVPEEDDVVKLLAADLAKDFDPDQPRDDHGRWSKIGEALHAISELVGEVAGHETFGAEEGHSDSHGIVVAHPGGDYSISLHDKDVGTHHVMMLADAEDSEDLSESLYEITKAHKANPSATGSFSSHPDAMTKWRADYDENGVTLHANLDDDENLEQVLLSYGDAESLSHALESVRYSAGSNDDPSHTPILARGEELVGGKKRFSDPDDQFAAVGAVVSTPDGPRFRLGAIQEGDRGLKDWTGGHGQTTVDLDREQAARVADILDHYAAEQKRRQAIKDRHYQEAEEAEEADGVELDWNEIDADVQDEIGPSLEPKYDSWEADYERQLVETPWGTIRLTDVGMDDEANGHRGHTKLEIWPKGMTEAEYDRGQEDTDGPKWAWPTSDERYEKPAAQILVPKMKALAKLLRQTFGEGSSLSKTYNPDQPRAGDGKWSRFAGISQKVMDGLESLYGPVLDVDSFHVGGDGEGNFDGWVSLHEGGHWAITHAPADPDGDPVEVLDSVGSPGWALARLPDDMREAADAQDDGDTEFSLVAADSSDPPYTLSVYDGDNGPELGIDTNTAAGWGFEDSGEAREFADRVEWLGERRDAWLDGEYDEDDDSEPDADADDLDKAAGHGGSSWEQQWKYGDLRKKWIGHPYPWTALYHHLRKHMPDEMAKRTAAQWHHDVFGIWPGEKKGKNPVGPG